MTYQQVSLELVRDGQCTPWGFRMTGGADIGTPLVIQKVTFGSPAEGELHRGDIVLSIRDKDATRLSHKGATDLILKAGSTIKIVVARNMNGVPMPTSPSSTPFPTGGNPFIYKALPTTNFTGQRQRRSSVESYTSTTSSDTEKEAIVNQPYRSIPLILPGAKVTKDIPVGSYLRFDPLCRSSTSSPSSNDPRFGDPYMLTKIQHTILEAAQTSSGASSPGRTPTPDMMMMNQNGTHMYLRQYNSPINMYSNQAIVEALAAQTVGSRKPALNNADILENKKLTNITQSPTYQLIHDEEWKKGKVEEHGPLEEHVYNVFPKDGVNAYRPEIHQSESFKSIMQDLKGISDM